MPPPISECGGKRQRMSPAPRRLSRTSGRSFLICRTKMKLISQTGSEIGSTDSKYEPKSTSTILLRDRRYINVTWPRLSETLATVRKADWIHARDHPFEIRRSHWPNRDLTMRTVSETLAVLQAVFDVSATIPLNKIAKSNGSTGRGPCNARPSGLRFEGRKSERSSTSDRNRKSDSNRRSRP